ncbi:DUF349 domain-containing protein [uncultured Draconibacterium sp.]|uniref:DUF349 domain-containing protein n=1 Tax=uncultured Draconibacterium sp. TaxID=1573823 RepID=UPI00321741E5
MEPKDLKNSEELKSPEKADLENSENVNVSEETKHVEEQIPQEKEPVAEPEQVDEKVATEEETVEPVVAKVEEESEPDDVKEEPEAATEETVAEVKPDEAEASVSTEESKEEEKVIVLPEKKEEVDYTKYSQVELINAMRDVLEESEEHNIKEEVDTIKAIFYKNLNENIAEAKKKFIEAGGNEEEFVPEDDPYEKDIKDLLKEFRHLRIEFNRKLEHEKEDNLKLKYQVIEDIKGLINNEESINKTFQDFKELQKQWRDIGLVPQSKMKNLWDTYHFHVENFYDYIKINRELRDLDLKKNLEAKIKLCERAEELLLESSIIKAFNTLQKYHEQWREIGPVPREQKDDIWERFKTATSTINKKHQEFFENRKVDQKKNLEAKTALCEKVEAINIAEIDNHKEWDEKSKELVKLQKLWRTIGFAPRKDNNKIYDRFRSACDKFFDAKREFYTKNKEFQQNNLQLKTDLCVQAEELKDNTDWKKTTQDFINIQKKWKEIGPVPRKQSDIIWKRFRAACDSFFEKKSEHFSGLDNEQVDNLKLKETLVQEVIDFKSTGNVSENLNLLKEFQRRWSEIGHVPFKKKEEIQSKFREAINKLYDELNIDDEKRNMLKFRSKMSSFSESSRGQNKMRYERDKYMNKMKQLENDLVLLDNNIGFFAESKNAESLIKDVQKKIEMTKQKIEFLRNKIRVIDEMDPE